jgi:hypothetical protein
MPGGRTDEGTGLIRNRVIRGEILEATLDAGILSYLAPTKFGRLEL